MPKKTKAALKAAIYCRVAFADNYTIKMQEETLRNYAVEHMIDVREVFSDNGATSGCLVASVLASSVGLLVVTSGSTFETVVLFPAAEPIALRINRTQITMNHHFL